MNQKNNFDEFDEIIFNFFDNNKEVPSSTTETIKNSLYLTQMPKKATIYFLNLKRIAIFVICFGLITFSAVFAKDIINFFNKIFTNSNRGIDTAVENGYVQNIDMDFVVCNNLGVKADYVLMDDNNLDISFIYKYMGNEYKNINEIAFTNLLITNEKNNILYHISNTESPSSERINYILSNQFDSKYIKIDNFTINNSLLITSNQFPNSKILFIEFTGFNIIHNNIKEHIEGHWKFSINLKDKFIYRTTENYIITPNKYITDISTKLTNTALILELKLNLELNSNNITENKNNIILKDQFNNVYQHSGIRYGNNINNNDNYKSTLILNYPVTLYDNLNNLFLHIELTPNFPLDLELIKIQ